MSEYAGVSVTSLLDLLNKENRYLNADELLEFILNKRIFFNNGYYWGNGDSPGSINTQYLKYITNDYGKGVTSTFESQEDKINKVTKERGKYWNYVKQKLFGNPENGDRGLIQIQYLEDDVLEKIVYAIFDPKGTYGIATKTYYFLDITVDPDLDLPENIEYYIDDLKKYKKQFVAKPVKRTSKKKIILVILLLLGISGCVTALALDLTITFFIFLAFTISYTLLILFWTQIKNCFLSCWSDCISEQYDENLTCIDKKNKNQSLKYQEFESTIWRNNSNLQIY